MRSLRAWFLRLGGQFGKQRQERELSAEMESHLAMHVEDNLRAGMTLDQARREALMKLGGIEQTKENVRDRRSLPFLETLMQDLKYAARMLRKNPGFSAVAVLSLALGIGANTTIFTVVNAVLLNPLPVREASRLVQMDTVDAKTHVTQARATKMGISFPNARDYRDKSDVFTGLAAWTIAPLTWSGGSEPKQLAGELVTSNYFDVLGLNPAVGRFFLPTEDKHPNSDEVAVLSYALWTNKFGSDRNVVGRTLTLNARPYTIIGVAPRGFKGIAAFVNAEQVWIPISMKDQALAGVFAEFIDDRRALMMVSFGRLKPGVSMSQAEASLKTLASSLEAEYPVDNAGRSVALTSIADAALGANNYDQIGLAGTLMMGFVGLVLLIACMNLANLLLAQGARREKEMAVRAAMGAGRARMFRQLLTESVLLSLAGGVVGLLIALWGRSVLWSFRPPFIEQSGLDLALDFHVLLFTLGVSLFTGLLFGLAPSVKACATDLIDILKTGGRGGTASWTHNPLRSLLVVFEVALALVALIGAGLFVRSMQNAQRIDPGFESKKLFVMGFDLGALHYDEGRGQQYFRAAIERASSVPGVESATIASNFPLGGGFARTTFPEGRDETSGYRGTLTNIDDIAPNFFETLRIPLLRGRLFNDADRKNTAPVAVVSEAMARHFWPNEEALGKRFHFFGDTTLREIVGIVGDGVVGQIGEEPQPNIYLPMTQDYSPFATLQVRTAGKPETVLASVRSQLQPLDMNLPFTNVQTIEEVLDQALWAPRMGAALLTLFGGVALVLAAVGVYGVLSYSVNQQTREIGLRMAMGAQRAQVLRLIVGQGFRLAAAGLALGLLAAFGLMRLMESLLFGVSTHDPLTFAGVALGLSIVALAACYIPARRAMRVDPIVSLRYE
jgi:predicted permease